MKRLLILFALLATALSVHAQQHVAKNAIRQKVLTADSTNSTTGLKSTPLSIAVDSNSTWELDAYLYTGSTTAAGMSLAVDIPSGATIKAIAFGTDTTVSQFNSDAITADATAGHSWNDANSQTGWVNMHGTVTVGSTTGNVVIQHKKNTSGVATLRSGSYLRLTKIQ
ncbi:MAG: hypothetical protein JSS75_07200 [Bacteroidetes bacterium]|nr:hypothetical protein [Bacteroidota bacterium]